MKIKKEYIKILLINMLIILPCFVNAWRKDTACTVQDIEKVWCNTVSNNFTQPYCVTNTYQNSSEVSDVNYAEPCIWTALTNNLSSIYDKWITLDKFTTRDVIEQYCLSLLWNSDTWRIYFSKPSSQTDNRDRQQTFDSHQSLFLYALCSSFTEWWNKPFINENIKLWDVYKWDISSLIKLQQISSWKNLCSLDNDYTIDDCDIAIYVSNIYSSIMSDLFKIKFSQVLHVDKSDNFDSEKNKKVEAFMSWYYSIDKKYDDIKTLYPKTVSTLESDQIYHKNILDSLKIINNTKLSNLANQTKCPINKDMTWANFIACALHSSQWNGFSLSPSFITLFYNELLHYRQFVSYYKNWVNAKIWLMSKNKMYEKEVKILQSKMEDFERYFNMQMEATDLTKHNFEEFNMSYPLHIRMLLYTEKSESFRNNSLSKVITSFYSLSEKLKNVQTPS